MIKETALPAESILATKLWPEVIELFISQDFYSDEYLKTHANSALGANHEELIRTARMSKELGRNELLQFSLSERCAMIRRRKKTLLKLWGKSKKQ